MHLIFKILCTFDILQYHLLYNCTGILILCLQIWTSWKNGFLTRKKAKQTKKANPYTDFHNGLYFSSTLTTKETDLQSILILGMNASLFVDRWSHRLERQRLLFLLVSHINLSLGKKTKVSDSYTQASDWTLLMAVFWFCRKSGNISHPLCALLLNVLFINVLVGSVVQFLCTVIY